MRKGVVYLVGAGPGDPGLITVKGRALLAQADVVIYDHLVSGRLLEACPPEAKLIYAGKEASRHTKSQGQINQLLIRHAKAGKIVIRLKGGDPVLFGRGGEEALALVGARVPFEIVPGVTSAIAAPAYAGIPVTHRAMASSVAFVTGHEDPAKSSFALRASERPLRSSKSGAGPSRALDWDRLATATDTLVVLMGVGALEQIARRLIRAGRARSTPCAVIEQGTLPTQRTVVGTLATIASRCRAAKLKPPAVIVVGQVAGLHRRLSWFERQPLFGRRIVVTRPTDRADRLAERLEALGAEVVRLPSIELAPVKANGAFHRAVQEMDDYSWVFFTSPEGLHWFRRMLAKERRDLRVLHGRHIGAIGPKTAASIEQAGIHVDFTPTTFSQEGMLKGLASRRLLDKRAMIVGAKDARDVLEEGLAARGMEVIRVPVYQTIVPRALRRDVRRVFQKPVDLVTATSSSCVDHLAQALRSCRLGRLMRRLRFASIGPATSATIRRHGGWVAVEARASTMEGLVEALINTGGRSRGLPRGSAA